jgi:hypothetical protein
MRLLHITTSGNLGLKEFFDTIPPYAILSHRWEEEEVTLEDLTKSKATGKKGYKKIELCCAQAAKDGFEYVWVDTCCTIQSHHRYFCPTKVAAYAAEDGGRMYIAIQYKCSNVALLSHLFIKESLFHTLIPDPNLVQRA